MRLIQIAPIAAALALAACGDSTDDELSEEALSMEDVVGDGEGAGMVPQPGEYSSSHQLIAFEDNSLSAAEIEEVLAQAAAEETTFCVAEDTTRDEYLSALADSDCSVSNFSTGGEDFEAVLFCTYPDELSGDPQGLSGTVALSGNAREDGARFELTFENDAPDSAGPMRFDVTTERVGDCG